MDVLTDQADMALIRAAIRDIPDFPKEGILFKDITTLLRDPRAFQMTIDALGDRFKNSAIDYVVGIESRGFIFGGPIAYKLGVGFVPVRKPGKLPGATTRIEYQLEYGTDALEIHMDAIEPGKRVLVVDDLLATGGTVKATIDLCEKIGAQVVGAAFLIELSFLNGKEKLPDCEVMTLVTY